MSSKFSFINFSVIVVGIGLGAISAPALETPIHPLPVDNSAPGDLVRFPQWSCMNQENESDEGGLRVDVWYETYGTGQGEHKFQITPVLHQDDLPPIEVSSRTVINEDDRTIYQGSSSNMTAELEIEHNKKALFYHPSLLKMVKRSATQQGTVTTLPVKSRQVQLHCSWVGPVR